MLHDKKIHPKIKGGLHIRNKHRSRYDFKELVASLPELEQYIIVNKYKGVSIDFFNSKAVKKLNKALLKHYYQIEEWDIPENYLCPPIPGRADYIHHIADLLYRDNPEFLKKESSSSKQIRCLDIGVGANCVYPIIGHHEYGWLFVGSDIDSISIQSATRIIEQNSYLKGKIELRLQKNRKNIFNGIIKNNEYFDLTICNPPFHASLSEAQSGTLRKLKNLQGKKVTTPTLNFGGQNNELWCEGGELRFVEKMILQSKKYRASCLWFSTLISKHANLRKVYKTLKNVGAVEVITIQMEQGNKISHIVAWTFLSRKQIQNWMNSKQ